MRAAHPSQRSRVAGAVYQATTEAGLDLTQQQLQFALIALALALLSACAATDVRDLGTQDHGYGVEQDERKLIARARRFEQELKHKGLVFSDAQVQDYISAVGTSLVPANAADALNFRFYVLRDSVVNAFALPNGSIYITVGLMARLENEAQLAHILSHEIAHVLQRHSLKSLRSSKAKMISSHIADVMLFGTSIAYLPYVVSVAGYSREQEQQADRIALELMSAQGYRLSDTYRLFSIMQEVKKTESIEGSIYSSHPSNTARTEDTKHIIEQRFANTNSMGKIRRAEYLDIKNQIVLENLRLKLLVKHYELTLDSVSQALKQSQATSWLYYYRGEAYRRMANDPKGAAREHAWIYAKENNAELIAHFRDRNAEFYRSAIQAYKQALALDQHFVQAHRGLGLVYYQQGEFIAARQSLKRYLTYGRDIRDRRYITHIMRKMEHS